MADIVLIHGYGIGRSGTIYTEKGLDGGFTAFAQLVHTKKAVLYRWDIKQNYQFIDLINPKKHYQIYKEEKTLANQAQQIQNLFNFLEEQQPKTVICHSMGALLLQNCLNRWGLPKSIKNIVFIQADIPLTFRITNVEIIQRLEEGSLRIVNYYCTWDLTLLTSVLLNKYLPAGLFPIKSRFVSNIFTPLITHTTTIEGKQSVKKIIQNLSN